MFFHFFVLVFVQTHLLAFPVKLVNHEGVTDCHAATIANSCLLLVDVLMDHIYQLLVKIVVFVSVLK